MMRMNFNRQIPLVVLAAALLVGCASYESPIPPGYTGPTVDIIDDGMYEGSWKAQLFYVQSIDGKAVESSRILTGRATAGGGPAVTLRYAINKVPVKPIKLRLVGTHVTGMPIHEVASRMAGTFFSVEGDVTFTPVEGSTYLVTGKLDKDSSAVWIAEVKTRQPASDVVTQRK